MATANIYFYSGLPAAEHNRILPLAEEPYLARDQVTTSSTAAASGAAPEGAFVPLIQVTVSTRYRVRLAGQSGDADASDPLLYADQANHVHCPMGATISLIEA